MRVLATSGEGFLAVPSMINNITLVNSLLSWRNDQLIAEKRNVSTKKVSEGLLKKSL